MAERTIRASGRDGTRGSCHKMSSWLGQQTKLVPKSVQLVWARQDAKEQYLFLGSRPAGRFSRWLIRVRSG
jgi:hypothetical protein